MYYTSNDGEKYSFYLTKSPYKEEWDWEIIINNGYWFPLIFDKNNNFSVNWDMFEYNKSCIANDVIIHINEFGKRFGKLRSFY